MITARRARIALIVVAVIGVASVVWSARAALGPFLVGGVLAYAVAPLVERLARMFPFYRTRHELARTLSILTIYVVGFGLFTLALLLIVPSLISEATSLVEKAPTLVEQARDQFIEWNHLYEERVPPDVRTRVDEYLRRFGEQLGGIAGAAFNTTIGFTSTFFSVVLGYLVVPFWLFYVLKDRNKIEPAIEAWFPQHIHEDVNQGLDIIRKVLGSYIRAQLTLGLFIGVITTFGLFLLGVEFYVILGIIAGITELIPIIGPILGAIPAIIVVLATDPQKVWLVILLYVMVQQVENTILVPRIQGNAVNMHPAVIIVLLVIAQQLLGLFGMLIAVPLAAVLRDEFVFVYKRLQHHELHGKTRERRRPLSESDAAD